MMKFTRTIISSYKCRSWWFSRSSFITAHQRIMKRMVIKSDSWQLVLSLLLWVFALFCMVSLKCSTGRPRQGNSQLWRVQLPMFGPVGFFLGGEHVNFCIPSLRLHHEARLVWTQTLVALRGSTTQHHSFTAVSLRVSLAKTHLDAVSAERITAWEGFQI